jgi:MarR family transcriptional regulator for hemolysin
MNYYREMFGIRFSTLSRQWRRYLDQQLAQIGINDVSWSPLTHLQLLGDGISQKQLAKSVGIEGPALVRLLDMLEQRGHIVRETCSSDRRSKLVYLTEEGKAVATNVCKHLQQIEAEFLVHLSDEQLLSFHQVLDTLEAQLEEKQ